MTGTGLRRIRQAGQGTGSSGEATCAKLIWFRAAPGRHDEYSAYLHDHVEPIDREAVREGALLDMITLLNPTGDAEEGSHHDGTPADSPAAKDRKPGAAANPAHGWTHLRIFLFDSAEQRAAVKSAFARIAPRLEPDGTLRESRKAAGTALRSLVAEQDVDLLG